MAPVTTTRCTICKHPRHADAEAWVAGGMSVSRAAKALGVDNQALGRHLANGHAPDLVEPKDPPAPIDGPADTVLDAIGAQLAAMLKGTNSTSQKLAILTEQRRLAESRARIVGPPASAPVTVMEVEGLGQLFEAFHERLKEWPDARIALAEVWREQRATAQEGS